MERASHVPDLPCETTTYPGPYEGWYHDLNDHAQKCECVGSLYDWVNTSDPPTRTRTVTSPHGSTTVTRTITSDSSTITTTVVSAVATTITETYTGNFIGAEFPTIDWYGTAKLPCVSLNLGPSAPALLMIFLLQCYSCTIEAGTVDFFHWPTRKLCLL